MRLIAGQRLLWIVFIFISLSIKGGCALGPEHRRPETMVDRADGYVHSGTVERPDEIPSGRWWERFNDPAVDELVSRALKGNLDLRISAVRVLEAEALMAVANGGRYPQLSYSLNANRSKNSFVLPTGRVGIFSTTFSQDLSASYQVDLFGRLKRTRQAAWADLLAASADRETVLHSIIAGVVRSRVRLAILERQLELARGNSESWQSTLEIIERRYGRGLASPLDVRLARENLASTEVTQVAFEELLGITRNALDVQLGERPGGGPEIPDTLSVLPDLEPVPVGLPAGLLDQRPDIRAAEMRLSAATARIGVAMADMFPSLTLTANAGIRSDDLKNLTSSDGFVYSLIANLLTPVFSGGTRKAQVEAVRARAEQSATTYAKVVLTALREVEDALLREEYARRRYNHLTVQLNEANAAEELAKTRYAQGLEPLLSLLETQRRRRTAETILVSTQGDIWNARIDLFLALGGDWETDT